MVIDLRAINKTVKILEAYYVSKNGYKLNGTGYDLILLVPAESTGLIKYSWLISGKILDNIPQTKIVSDIFQLIKGVLSIEEYATISRINVINSSHPFIRNVNFVVPGNDEMVQFNNQNIGGVDLDQAILLRPKFLKKAKEGNAVTFILNTGKKINAGIISIDKNLKIKHYTGKGLREIYGEQLPNFNKERAKELKSKSENYLITNEYIGFTNFNDIKNII